MNILALDLGKFNTMCCFFDSKTREYTFLDAATERGYLTTLFKQHKNNIDLVVMEACGPSGWINDLARSFGLKTLVCSTNEDAWRWSNVKRKTDKDDALKLARMAAMGELKPVHMPSETHREFRSLVKYRKTLDQRIEPWESNPGDTHRSRRTALLVVGKNPDAPGRPFDSAIPEPASGILAAIAFGFASLNRCRFRFLATR